jgi:hypothetical protein
MTATAIIPTMPLRLAQTMMRPHNKRTTNDPSDQRNCD